MPSPCAPWTCRVPENAAGDGSCSSSSLTASAKELEAEWEQRGEAAGNGHLCSWVKGRVGAPAGAWGTRWCRVPELSHIVLGTQLRDYSSHKSPWQHSPCRTLPFLAVIFWLWKKKKKSAFWFKAKNLKHKLLLFANKRVKNPSVRKQWVQ